MLSRWIPAQERRVRPRDPDENDAADAYRRLLKTDTDKPRSRWPRRIAFAVAALGVGGWLWRRPSRASHD